MYRYSERYSSTTTGTKATAQAGKSEQAYRIELVGGELWDRGDTRHCRDRRDRGRKQRSKRRTSWRKILIAKRRQTFTHVPESGMLESASWNLIPVQYNYDRVKRQRDEETKRQRDEETKRRRDEGVELRFSSLMQYTKLSYKCHCKCYCELIF